MKTSVVFFPFDLFGSPGTAAGVEALAEAFHELLDDNAREKAPTRARAYQQHIKVKEFSFATLEAVQSSRKQARRTIRQRLADGDFLLWIAGNHLGTLPLYEELARLPGETVVVQLDAHLDVYNLRDCESELTHGNFLLHAEEPLPTLLNLGHRELLLPADHVARTFRATYSAADLAIDPLPALRAVTKSCQRAERVVIDLDCDVFDPAFFPAVRQPLPFGMSPQLVLRVLEAAWSDKLAAIALSEFDPVADVRDVSLTTLVWLLEYVLLKKYQG